MKACLLAVSRAVVWMLFLGAVWGADGQIKIAQTTSTTFPIIITDPGSYVLTSNLTVTQANVHAIEIRCNSVTLDLNGHNLQGPGSGSTGAGIYALDRFSITIRNGRIRRFAEAGVYLEASSDEAQYRGGHLIEEVQSTSNGRGFWVEGGTVSRCAAHNNHFAGFHVFSCVVVNCTASQNGSGGGNGFGCLSYSTLTNCIAINNELSGIAIIGGTVNGCTAGRNADDGISAEGSVVRGCNASNNKKVGIRLMGSGLAYGNAAYNNTQAQILCPAPNVCVNNAPE